MEATALPTEPEPLLHFFLSSLLDRSVVSSQRQDVEGEAGLVIHQHVEQIEISIWFILFYVRTS